MADLARPGLFAWPAASPVGQLRARITAGLDARSIPLDCGHAGALGYRLTLPGWRMVCHECHLKAPAPAESGPCAACGSEGARLWTGWLHQAPITGVAARICRACAASRTVMQTWN